MWSKWKHEGIIVLLMALSFLLGTCTRPQADPVEIVRTDTIRQPIPVFIPAGIVKTVKVPIIKHTAPPQIVRIAEVEQDTAKEKIVDLPTLKGDSIEIPIERRIYKTDKYTATVEGWRPTLVDMEVYNTVIRTKPRFAVVAGVGTGWDGRRIVPTVGVTIGITLLSK